MSESIVGNKSIDFAVRIVNLSKYLNNEKKEFVLSNQILRSGTSIGANLHEANNTQSDADFISKLSIALKETSETKYWLILLQKTDYITNAEYESLYSDCEELFKMISSSILTSKEKMKNKQSK